ncbi:MAG TPA: hypothetical protein ACFYEF_10690, partial [Candidatus Wunengus sp. YC63]|uniref:hypothetical protein n=1 Tax=Candidatus Wunengus sp. YC63 TaxID=3367699 RepID=UPI00402998F8
ILQDENYEKFEQVYLRFETMTGIMVNPEIQPIATFEEPQKTDVVLRGEEIRSLKKKNIYPPRYLKGFQVPEFLPKRRSWILLRIILIHGKKTINGWL